MTTTATTSTTGKEMLDGIHAAFDAAEKRGETTLTPHQMLQAACGGKLTNDAARYRYRSFLQDIMARSIIKAHRNDDNVPTKFERVKPRAKH